jgi:phenolic acid decarboxylase
MEGPTAGATFEHTLNTDGSIDWRAIDGAVAGASGREKQCSAAKINDQIWVVSYLGESGHTLTVVLNFANHEATGFASSDTAWFQLRGTFYVVS